MEEGSLRCDANVSVMKENDKDYGTKVEIKNMNSTRNIKKAIDFEIDRQIELIEQGKSIVQETRYFYALTNATNSMRTNEKASSLELINHNYENGTVNLKVNSIDQKAKQFADFFNGEIVNLE